MIDVMSNWFPRANTFVITIPQQSPMGKFNRISEMLLEEI